MKSKTLNGKANVVGTNIQKYRLLKELSLRQLSDKLVLVGVSLYYSDIFDIESHSRLVKDFELKAICKVLNVTYDEIYENTDSFYEV